MTETKKNPIGRFIENTLVPNSPRTDTSAASAQAPKT